jgi:DAK2 domain fusion protein YloV
MDMKIMLKTESMSGQEFREMFAAAINWLEKSSPDIDALNVFPVPDGDTGTNMLLTMRSTIEESYRAPDHSTAAVVQAMAKGALLGARGNSGVILSQIWSGLAKGMDSKDTITGEDLAEALVQASIVAYKGISNPVEGTILTVMREAASAAKLQAAHGNKDILSIMEATVNAAHDSVANTPQLLPALKEAGVVDAGGQGLYTLLEGAYRYLKGESEEMQFRKPQMVVSNVPMTSRLPQIASQEEVPYGYCTELLIKGKELDPEKLRAKLDKKGQSLIVVGDPTTVRVHIHALDPGSVIHYATSLGTLHQVRIRNMDEQHQDFIEMQKDKMPKVDMAIIAVVSGDGLKDVFSSLGATHIVDGGQTMNPSTKDLLQAVEQVGAAKIIILPNNKNVVMTAEQVQSLTQKRIDVIPTRTIPQGIAALLAMDFEADFETNAMIMRRAKSTVKTIEITRAARSTQLGGLSIKKKQTIGFLDGDLVAVGNSTLIILDEVLERLNLEEAEIITIYYGADIESSEAEEAGRKLREQHNHIQVEVVRGGQPHYDYLVSVE